MEGGSRMIDTDKYKDMNGNEIDVEELFAEIRRLRRHLEDVVDELATHLGDYEDEMYDWIRKMHKLYGSD
jgi:hypothetical protein